MSQQWRNPLSLSAEQHRRRMPDPYVKVSRKLKPSCSRITRRRRSFGKPRESKMRLTKALARFLRSNAKSKSSCDGFWSCQELHTSLALPAGVKVTSNLTAKHFSGAGGEVIERSGDCEILFPGRDSCVRSRWNLADVSRLLRSVSRITGPIDGNGSQDVLFKQKVCVVVPQGIVDAIIRQIKPIALYWLEGKLYLADFPLGFCRAPPESMNQATPAPSRSVKPSASPATLLRSLQGHHGF